MFGWLKKIKFKMVSCCGSKCSIGMKDTDGDGIPDKINIEIEKK